MRTIVLEQGYDDGYGIQAAQIYFRIPINGANRQAFYKKQQATFVPNAPADTNAPKQQQEVTDFQNGLYVELPPFRHRMDPNLTDPQKAAQLDGLYADAVNKYTAYDNARFALYGTAKDAATGWGAVTGI